MYIFEIILIFCIFMFVGCKIYILIFGMLVGYNYIGIEYLLFGFLREGEGVVVRVLENLGVDLGNIWI